MTDADDFIKFLIEDGQPVRAAQLRRLIARVRELETQARTLREAMEEAASNCRNAGRWCMDLCTDRDSCNVCSPLRAALDVTAPKEKPCAT